MSFLPGKYDFIDIHSHFPGQEEGEFRIYNHLLTKGEEIPEGMAVSCGLHPWHIGNYRDKSRLFDELSSFCERENVVALGEAGLDKVIDTPIEEQEEVFRTHIEVAGKYNKPLIVHCVKAADLLLKIRKESRPEVPWIYHGFNSSAQMAEDMFNHRIFVSIGQRLTRNRKKLKEILDRVPLSGIFLETDDDETGIRGIYEAVAEIAGIEVRELREYVWGSWEGMGDEGERGRKGEGEKGRKGEREKGRRGERGKGGGGRGEFLIIVKK